MAIQQERGRDGEMMAVRYLANKGYEILQCNWRYSHYEVDIIALKEGIVRIVEVKTRQNIQYGMPEESMTRKKFDNLKKAAAFLQQVYPQCKRIQFDVLCITIRKQGSPDFFLIEDFYL